MVHSVISTVSRSKACKLAIAGAMLLMAANAMADAEARNGQDWVRITGQPCTNAAVLERLDSAPAPVLWQAEAEFQGVRYAPCWHPTGNAIQLLYEDGDQGVLPTSTLRQVLLT